MTLLAWQDFNYSQTDECRGSESLSRDSEIIEKQCQEVNRHFLLIPYSRVQQNPIQKFYDLAITWQDDTKYSSSISEIVLHPAYQEIIGMGAEAIPLILNELRQRTAYWFWALSSITGENPVLPHHRGNISQITNDWLKWGRQKGYLITTGEQ